MPSKQHKLSFTYVPQKGDFLSCQLDHFLRLNEQLCDFILYYTSRPVRSSCSKQPSHTSQLYLPSQAETLDGERRKLKRKYSTLNSSMFLYFANPQQSASSGIHRLIQTPRTKSLEYVLQTLRYPQKFYGILYEQRHWHIGDGRSELETTCPDTSSLRIQTTLAAFSWSCNSLISFSMDCVVHCRFETLENEAGKFQQQKVEKHGKCAHCWWHQL